MALRKKARAETSLDFSYWLKRRRMILDATQKEFASLWGVSASMVQKIEVGEYELGQLSFDRLELLRELLKMDASQFYSIMSSDSKDDVLKDTAERMIESHADVVAIPYLHGADKQNATSEALHLPKALLGQFEVDSLRVLTVQQDFFATDRVRYTLPVDSSVVVNQYLTPTTGDIVAAQVLVMGELESVIFQFPQLGNKVFLRPYNAKDQRAIEIDAQTKLEHKGVFAGSWVSSNLSK